MHISLTLTAAAGLMAINFCVVRADYDSVVVAHHAVAPCCRHRAHPAEPPPLPHGIPRLTRSVHGRALAMTMNPVPVGRPCRPGWGLTTWNTRFVQQEQEDGAGGPSRGG